MLFSQLWWYLSAIPAEILAELFRWNSILKKFRIPADAEFLFEEFRISLDYRRQNAVFRRNKFRGMDPLCLVSINYVLSRFLCGTESSV